MSRYSAANTSYSGQAQQVGSSVAVVVTCSGVTTFPFLFIIFLTAGFSTTFGVVSKGNDTGSSTTFSLLVTGGAVLRIVSFPKGSTWGLVLIF